MTAIRSHSHQLPFVLLRHTADFVPLKELFYTMHHVSKLWNEVYPFILHNADLSYTRVTRRQLSLLIQKCQHIFSLNLSGCPNMNDAEISCLSSLRTLTRLNISHCPITDVGIGHLAPVPLQQLIIRGAYTFYGTGLLSLPSSLTDLDITNCPYFDFPFFNGLSLPLEHLNLSLSRPTYDIYRKMGYFPLKTLNLTHSFIADQDLQYLKKTPLITLDLTECRFITGREFIHLTYISTLRTLILDGCPVTFGFQSLKNLQLERLSLRNCRGFQNYDLSYLPISLTDLDVSFCSQLTNLGLTYITNLYNLQKLAMAHCKKIKPRQFDSLNRLENLTNLNISFCDINNEVLFNLKKLPLKRLQLVKCKKININGIQHLTALPLTDLNLTSCNSVDDNAIGTLVDLPLNILNLTNCFRITYKVFPHLQKMRQLQALNIVRSGITEHRIVLLTTLKLKSLWISKSCVNAHTLPMLNGLRLTEFHSC